MKKIALFIVSVLLVFSLSGCGIVLETYPLAEHDLVRVVLKNGKEEKTVYLNNMSTHTDIDIPTKADSTFVGYYDSEVGGVCCIDANGKKHAYYLDEFPRTLYARFTTVGNETEIINIDTIRIDSEKVESVATSAIFTETDFSTKNYSTLNIYFSFMLRENQDFWADYAFSLVDAFGNELCEKITLQENYTTNNVFETGYMGCIQISQKAIGGIGYKFERLENTAWVDNIDDFVIVIEYIA